MPLTVSPFRSTPRVRERQLSPEERIDLALGVIDDVVAGVHNDPRFRNCDPVTVRLDARGKASIEANPVHAGPAYVGAQARLVVVVDANRHIVAEGRIERGMPVVDIWQNGRAHQTYMPRGTRGFEVLDDDGKVLGFRG